MSLAKDGSTLICKEIAEEGFSHAERLHVFIEEIIREAGITFQDLNAIAVSQGPGPIRDCELEFQRPRACVMLWIYR